MPGTGDPMRIIQKKPPTVQGQSNSFCTTTRKAFRGRYSG